MGNVGVIDQNGKGVSIVFQSGKRDWPKTMAHLERLIGAGATIKIIDDDGTLILKASQEANGQKKEVIDGFGKKVSGEIIAKKLESARGSTTRGVIPEKLQAIKNDEANGKTFVIKGGTITVEAAAPETATPPKPIETPLAAEQVDPAKLRERVKSMFNFEELNPQETNKLNDHIDKLVNGSITPTYQEIDTANTFKRGWLKHNIHCLKEDYRNRTGNFNIEQEKKELLENAAAVAHAQHLYRLFVDNPTSEQLANAASNDTTFEDARKIGFSKKLFDLGDGDMVVDRKGNGTLNLEEKNKLYTVIDKLAQLKYHTLYINDKEGALKLIAKEYVRANSYKMENLDEKLAQAEGNWNGIQTDISENTTVGQLLNKPVFSGANRTELMTHISTTFKISSINDTTSLSATEINAQKKKDAAINIAKDLCYYYEWLKLVKADAATAGTVASEAAGDEKTESGKDADNDDAAPETDSNKIIESSEKKKVKTPDNVENLIKLGMQYEDKKDFAKAVENYLLACTKNHVEYVDNLTRALGRWLGNTKESPVIHDISKLTDKSNYLSEADLKAKCREYLAPLNREEDKKLIGKLGGKSKSQQTPATPGAPATEEVVADKKYKVSLKSQLDSAIINYGSAKVGTDLVKKGNALAKLNSVIASIKKSKDDKAKSHLVSKKTTLDGWKIKS